MVCTVKAWVGHLVEGEMGSAEVVQEAGRQMYA